MSLPGPVSAPSAKAASILVDLLGAETYADQAVAYIRDHIGAPMDDEDLLLVKVGAVKGAQLVMDQIREFAERN